MCTSVQAVSVVTGSVTAARQLQNREPADISLLPTTRPLGSWSTSGAASPVTGKAFSQTPGGFEEEGVS